MTLKRPPQTQTGGRRFLIALGLTIFTSITFIKIGGQLYGVKLNPYYHYGVPFRATCALIITLA